MGSAHAAAPDPLVALVNAYRAAPTGCDGRPAPPLKALTAPPALSALRVGPATMLDNAIARAGYAAAEADAIYLNGGDDPAQVMGMIEQRYCRLLRSPRYGAMGVVRNGASWLIVLARPAPPPVASLLPPQDEAGRQVLGAVNAARAIARRCGVVWYPAAPPVSWNAALARAALAHSTDMASRRYFSHEGKDGSTAAERARAAGYPWQHIGENIAAGQDAPADAVRGWLESPGHCANIMSDDVTEMGAAYAVNAARTPARIYWTQVFGRQAAEAQ